ncbi:MAG: MBL fold metallo-hydrolase [Bacteroidales bacterium]|nr:MBL fold metallo-hydrolase [Candidatus Latescibacterota bacterium]
MLRLTIILCLFTLGVTLPSGSSAQSDPVIKVIYNNVVDDEDFERAGGFSCVVEGLEKTILFDTGGNGTILMKNMAKMGIDPGSIDLVLLSHFHWDHTEGLDEFLKKNSKVIVFAPASFPDEWKTGLRRNKIRLVDVSGPMILCEDVFTTGERGSEIVEQSLLIKTTGGTILITGCAHPGIVSIVEKAMDLTGKQVLLAMGGFHLRDHSEEELGQVLQGFSDLGVVYCGASHCTGDEQIAAIKDAYGERYVNTGVGSIIDVSKFEWRPSSGTESGEQADREENRDDTQ